MCACLARLPCWDCLAAQAPAAGAVSSVAGAGWSSGPMTDSGGISRPSITWTTACSMQGGINMAGQGVQGSSCANIMPGRCPPRHAARTPKMHMAPCRQQGQPPPAPLLTHPASRQVRLHHPGAPHAKVAVALRLDARGPVLGAHGHGDGGALQGLDVHAGAAASSRRTLQGRTRPPTACLALGCCSPRLQRRHRVTAGPLPPICRCGWCCRDSRKARQQHLRPLVRPPARSMRAAPTWSAASFSRSATV